MVFIISSSSDIFLDQSLAEQHGVELQLDSSLQGNCADGPDLPRRNKDQSVGREQSKSNEPTPSGFRSGWVVLEVANESIEKPVRQIISHRGEDSETGL